MTSKRAEPVWMCRDCGHETAAWSGRCASCGAWNTLFEVRLPSGGTTYEKGRSEPLEVVRLNERRTTAQTPRLRTEIDEVDQVLGGGFFPGTVVLLSGEPGIGKSTLLLAVAERISRATSTLYISGEESTTQIEERAARLGLVPSTIQLAATTDLLQLFDFFKKNRPQFIIIDSIQTLVDTRYPSAAGSTVQVRECALALQRWAKTTGATLLLVGHVTKEGVVAGPRTLEHLVDVVLVLDGDRTGDLRFLHSDKNRFGPTDEVGVLSMTSDGLRSVTNPSARFLADRLTTVSGSIVTVVIEGSRPFLVEIQALARRTSAPYPRRVASGFDSGRLELLLAVLEARAEVALGQHDCYVNVSGGLRLKEPAADLAVALAVASAVTGRVLPAKLVAFGEVGLAGEIRPVPAAKRRRQEAERLGFTERLAARTLRGALEELHIQGERSRHA